MSELKPWQKRWRQVRYLWRTSEKPWNALWRWATKLGPASQEKRFTTLKRWARKKAQAAAEPYRSARRVYARFARRAARERDQQSSERKIVSRSEWGAAPARRNPGRMRSTSNGVFVHHTVTELSANATVAQEKAHMRHLQRIAFNEGYADISYSFVVFQSGRICEGRGLNVAGAHTQNDANSADYNWTAYGLAAVGNFENLVPTDALIASLRWLRRDYLKLGSAPLRGHRQVRSTACPGRHLYARIRDL